MSARRYAISIVGGVLLACASGTPARAQPPGDASGLRSGSSPRPVEIEVGTGYLQGLGATAPSNGTGMAVAAGLDYRPAWRWALGVEGEFYDVSAGPSSPAYGVTADLGATWHFNPQRHDAWLRLGTGYRFLWESDPSGTSGAIVLRQGFEPLALKAGYDVDLSEDLAVAAVIAAGFDLFAWSDAAGRERPSSIEAGGFVYAGLQGRFKLGD